MLTQRASLIVSPSEISPRTLLIQVRKPAVGNATPSASPKLNAWDIAKEQQLSDPELSAEERAMLDSFSPQGFIDEVTSMERRHANESKIRKVMSGLRPWVRAVAKAGPAMDVLSNAVPHGILALVWGSVRLILVVCLDQFGGRTLHHLTLCIGNQGLLSAPRSAHWISRTHGTHDRPTTTI